MDAAADSESEVTVVSACRGFPSMRAIHGIPQGFAFGFPVGRRIQVHYHLLFKLEGLARVCRRHCEANCIALRGKQRRIVCSGLHLEARTNGCVKLPKRKPFPRRD
ncbi:hypothetical protein Cob_v005661 [Colletotrichum orbiculare MAFF 240422]|uniref:Uncharacterized protein n=1 Tax=Colletotrichum orbiculare (strain 104-T / ATCC 96160 / CBS 514.97 / LARS 414 / MAFF 240422) TaxID=1213857 RepID=A0A484FVL6_COLOR|nr:hypothetical protein Cob_v005661 [Colletotrichum orbiculare MAFF 240422]